MFFISCGEHTHTISEYTNQQSTAVPISTIKLYPQGERKIVRFPL